MEEKGLSIYDIRSIGAGRYVRKLYKSVAFWVSLLMILALLVISLVGASTEAPQYTLPSGEVVELDGGKLMLVDESIVIERDNATSPWSLHFYLASLAVGLLVAGIVYTTVQEERARDKIMEEWLAAGYQPKATDV